ncbi:MAG: TonB-dependent receptor [Cyclobacteriaceae bacterium]|nr:TonB-dependent receptor [Cyclobacteriaceae bacterium]
MLNRPYINNFKSGVLPFLIALFSWLGAQAQQKEIPLQEAFDNLQKNKKVRFFYQPEWVEGIIVDQETLTLPLSEFLDKAFSNTSLSYVLYKKKYVILFNDLPDSLQNRFTGRARKIDERTFVPDGKEYSMGGKVKEANSGESIVGASIYIEELKTGTVTDVYGGYSITVPSGIYTLQISAIGKAPATHRVILQKNISLDIDLFDHLTQLSEVIVKGEAMDKNISSIDMGLVKLDLKTLQSIPSFLGEADIIKSITLLPGVSTVGEGAGGFNVRGGNTDQNLVLIDDVPVFNTSHLFGFFSTVNTDIVKDVALYKGGMPAQYGGRISSVLDIKLKDGNLKEFTGSGGVGTISSKFSLEGPIVKDKASFVVGGRYAYPNWILKKVPDYSIRNSEGDFYDAHATLNYHINEKNTLRYSSYYSVDRFKFAADTVFGWSTFNSIIKWNSLVSKKLFFSTSAFFSNYVYSIEGLSDNSEFKTDFGIRNIGAKVDGSYFITLENKIDFGVSTTFYDFNPGALNPAEGSSINHRSLQQERSIESGLYINNEFKLNARIGILAGLRYSIYSNIGPQDILLYEPGIPKSPSSVIDTLSFGSGSSIKTYSGLEPRSSVRITLDDQSSVKISYNRTIQYLHLISNTTAISPVDVWKPSNYYIKPQTGQQLSLGYFKNLKDNAIETSVEFYYKEIQNMVEYKDGADLFLNPFLESELLPAFGKAYGAEVLVRKNHGKLTGWAGYTFSRSLRQVKGSSQSETINRGKFYPSNFDKPHDLTVAMNYRFTRRLSISSNFTFNSGRPITYPSAVFIVDGYSIVQFDERNQGRIPDYHRLDVSFIFDKTLKQTKRWKGSWAFSVYNLYGRKNPYSVFFSPTYKGSLPQAYRLAVLGTIFPSLSYNFKF